MRQKKAEDAQRERENREKAKKIAEAQEAFIMEYREKSKNAAKAREAFIMESYERYQMSLEPNKSEEEEMLEEAQRKPAIMEKLCNIANMYSLTKLQAYKKLAFSERFLRIGPEKKLPDGICCYGDKCWYEERKYFRGPSEYFQLRFSSKKRLICDMCIEREVDEEPWVDELF